MTLYKCDACGKCFANPKCVQKISIPFEEFSEREQESTASMERDFCRGCCDKLRAYVKIQMTNEWK